MYQNGGKDTKLPLKYQMAIKYKYQMAVKYSNSHKIAIKYVY
jgi:hypothetical protein